MKVLKKVTCMVLLFSFLLAPTISQAQTAISSDTVITEDNIYDVLAYLGLDSSGFTRTDTANSSVTTVGDLEKYIQNAKKQSKNITIKPNSINPNGSVTGSGTLTLSNSVLNNGISLSYLVSAGYAYGAWTNVSSITASASSNTPGVTCKIASQSSNGTCTATTVTVQSTVTVDTYIGIGKVGIIKYNSFDVTTTMYWYASDYLATFM